MLKIECNSLKIPTKSLPPKPRQDGEARARNATPNRWTVRFECPKGWIVYFLKPCNKKVSKLRWIIPSLLKLNLSIETTYLGKLSLMDLKLSNSR